MLRLVRLPLTVGSLLLLEKRTLRSTLSLVIACFGGSFIRLSTPLTGSKLLVTPGVVGDGELIASHGTC